MIFETLVTEHHADKFLESTGLRYLCDVLPDYPTGKAPVAEPKPNIIDAHIAHLAEHAVEEYNRKMYSQLEFIDALKVNEYTEGYDLTLQVAEHGKHMIYLSEFKETESPLFMSPIGPFISTGFRYISEAQPRPKALIRTFANSVPGWLLPGLLRTVRETFNVAMLKDHQLNSVCRLSKITGELTEEKVKQELIPFLDFEKRIRENDEGIVDDDLLALVFSLNCFVPFVEGLDFAHVLIPPLETLCKVEKPMVRSEAVKALCQIGDQMKENDLLTWFLPLVKRLATGSYADRVSSSALFSIVYPSAPEISKAELRMLYSHLCQDDMAVVRRSATSNLGKFSAVVEPI